jgi:hypothetical protein
MTIKTLPAFRSWLVSELKRTKFTVYRLSKLSGVPAPSIHRVIYGEVLNPELNTVLKLAAALNQNVNISGTETKQSTDEPTDVE